MKASRSSSTVHGPSFQPPPAKSMVGAVDSCVERRKHLFGVVVCVQQWCVHQPWLCVHSKGEKQEETYCSKFDEPHLDCNVDGRESNAMCRLNVCAAAR
jgi:hypothetical protein